jgi:hypothetical protein
MTAFTYPDEPHLRRHGPQGYADAASYRPWLRDEFAFRCVYCLFREQWGKLRGTFSVEHFRPIASHPSETLSYDNLLYGCSACNVGKGKQLVPDPLTALRGADVWVNEDRTIEGRTRQARRLIRVLGLDDREYTEFRLMWMEIVSLAAREDPELHCKLMGFPSDLPNVARLRPPGGNSRPEGIEQSYFVRKQKEILPQTY